MLNMKYSVRFCEMRVEDIHCEKKLVLISSKSINKKDINLRNDYILGPGLR